MIDDILVTPSWEADDVSGNDVPAPCHTLRIDPGTAFGTGAHETTQIAIRLLRKQVEAQAGQSGVRVLDIGTGSGILGILALMFGAQSVTGVDVDAFTEEAVRQNLAANAVDASRFTLLTGNLLDNEAFRAEVARHADVGHQAEVARHAGSGEPGGDATDGGYEIVIANILPVVLKPLTPLVPRFLKQNGVYLLSGILCEKEAEMKQVLLENGFDVLETMRQGAWCGIAARLQKSQ